MGRRDPHGAGRYPLTKVVPQSDTKQGWLVLGGTVHTDIACTYSMYACHCLISMFNIVVSINNMPNEYIVYYSIVHSYNGA